MSSAAVVIGALRIKCLFSSLDDSCLVTSILSLQFAIPVSKSVSAVSVACKYANYQLLDKHVDFRNVAVQYIIDFKLNFIISHWLCFVPQTEDR